MIKDLEVDAHQEWQTQHWRSIVSAYARAPFFEHYAPELEQLFRQNSRFLLDYTIPMLTLCLRWLELPLSLTPTETYNHSPEIGIKDERNMISPKKMYSSRRFYQPIEYPQVFGKDFAENLSIIDLIACEGPNARSVLRSSKAG